MACILGPHSYLKTPAFMKKNLPLSLKYFALLSIAVTTFAPLLRAAPLELVHLWPQGAPETITLDSPEMDRTKPEDDLVDGRYVARIGNITDPTLTFYPAPAAQNTGTTVLVCPGGGYWIVAYDLEGIEVCQWLNSIGVNAALLKYRVPRREGKEKHAAALEDAARAMQIIRSKSVEWNLDPTQVGVLGFSAGGHLSATLSNTAIMPEVKGYDAIEGMPVRPDFALLIYPAYLTDKEQNDAISPEVQPTAETPPTFISISMDDPVRVENAIHYALALKAATVPAELHIYTEGGHGYGLRRTANPVTTWPDRVEDWMRYRGLLQ